MTSQWSEVLKWHSDNGGHFAVPHRHGLRMLREAIELCVALGSSPKEIKDTCRLEIDKAYDRKEYHPDRIDRRDVYGEIADVEALFEVLCSYLGMNRTHAVADKLRILHDREWEVDGAGVLWRPGAIGQYGQDIPDRNARYKLTTEGLEQPSRHPSQRPRK